MKWNSVLANGYWARYAVLGAALLWLTVLALILLQQDISCPASQPFSAQTDLRRRPYPHSVNACGELRRHLDQLKVEVASLQEENRQLKHLAASRSFRPVEAGQFLLQRAPIEEGDIEKQENTELRKVEPLVVAAERRLEGQLFSQEHEVSRRQLLNGIWELYLRLNGPEIGQKLGSADQQRLGDQFAHLLAHARSFSQLDRAEEWHKKVLDRVADRIRQTLDRLQNPRDCGQARLMLCELNKGCGFGCQLHHVSYCLLMAAAANRTMVLERDGSEWRYSDQGWKAAFLPVGKCTWVADVSSSGPPAEPFHDLGQSARIVRLPIVDGLAVRPPQLPLSFPSQFADLLLTHHSNPPVFFIAQFLAFLMRENKQTSEFVQRAEKQIPFELGPVVGLQIRRTDKVGTEAAYHSVEEYFRWADLWFHVEQIRLGIPLLARRAFIATDDPAVIDEARQKYGSKGWIIFGNDETAEAAQPGSRYSDRSLLGVIADVRLLSRCSYIVCTFSSQVCRMGYELMQTRLGDAGEQVHSLDDIFYFGGQLAHEVEALASYQADGPDQIDLMKGDIIGIAGNHWDGWSKGTNRRTGQSGLFPSYLAREKWRIVDFPIFDN